MALVSTPVQVTSVDVQLVTTAAIARLTSMNVPQCLVSMEPHAMTTSVDMVAIVHPATRSNKRLLSVLFIYLSLINIFNTEKRMVETGVKGT